MSTPRECVLSITSTVATVCPGRQTSNEAGMTRGSERLTQDCVCTWTDHMMWADHVTWELSRLYVGGRGDLRYVDVRRGQGET